MADVGAEFLFQVITERAERATVIITTFALSRGFSGRAGTPRTPLPGSTAKRLTDADHFCMIRTAQRRFAPTVFGITPNSDRHKIGIGDRLRRNTQTGPSVSAAVAPLLLQVTIRNRQEYNGLQEPPRSFHARM